MAVDVICIGEPVASLGVSADGAMTLAPGGDVLPVAMGLARLRPTGAVGLAARFGGDSISTVLLRALADEGVDCALSRAAPHAVCAIRASHARRAPGGARWAAAPPMRRIFTDEDRERIYAALRAAKLVYLTGSLLAALPEEERGRLLQGLRRTQLAFDASFDARDWASRDDAALWVETAYKRARIILTTPRQEAALFGSAGGARDAGHAEIVLRNGAGPSLIARDGVWVEVAPEQRLLGGGGARAFNVGYLSARLDKQPVAVAAKAGHALAALAILSGGGMPSRDAIAGLRMARSRTV